MSIVLLRAAPSKETPKFAVNCLSITITCISTDLCILYCRQPAQGNRKALRRDCFIHIYKEVWQTARLSKRDVITIVFVSLHQHRLSHNGRFSETSRRCIWCDNRHLNRLSRLNRGERNHLWGNMRRTPCGWLQEAIENFEKPQYLISQPL